MTRIEYELLREELPEFKFPEYLALYERETSRLPFFTRETLIAARFAVLLGRDPGTTDSVRYLPRPIPLSPCETNRRSPS